MPNHDEAVQLIQRAFAMARESGKPDWVTMTLPVLKNRLLLLTGGRFRESDYGARTMLEFASGLGEIASLDETSKPPALTVRLSADIDLPMRIRADLWRASLDYSSKKRYAWDKDEQVAVEAVPDDTRPIVPTLSLDDLKEWRGEFIKEAVASGSAKSREFDSWIQSGATRLLPEGLIRAWNRTVVAKLEQRLTKWFESLGLPLPDDVVEKPRRRPNERPEITALRAFVLRCVSSMTEEELHQLLLPATALLRVQPVGR